MKKETKADIIGWSIIVTVALTAIYLVSGIDSRTEKLEARVREMAESIPVVVANKSVKLREDDLRSIMKDAGWKNYSNETFFTDNSTWMYFEKGKELKMFISHVD